jgi:recombination protein RecT
MTDVATKTKAEHPLTILKSQIAERAEEYRFALPAHIPPERFIRVIQTAVQNNLGLVKCDRASFFNAALRAAQDGLIPDGREGAIVEYRDSKKNIVLAQWMPMYQGILKKVRNSGEFKWATAQVVYDGDAFEHWVDEGGEHLRHTPAGESDRPMKVYAVVTTKSGGSFVEVMTVAQVKKVQAVSRAKSEYGPWAKWWDEMAKKTVFRRLSKRLPISADLDDLIRRDDALYDFESAREQSADENPKRIKSISAAFDRFADGPTIDHSATDDVSDLEGAPEPAPKNDGEFDGGDDAKPTAAPPAGKKPDPAPPQSSKPATGNDAGIDENARQWPLDQTPNNEDDYQFFAETKIETFANVAEMETWWRGEEQRKLRNACDVKKATFDQIVAFAKAHADKLRKAKG